MKGMKKQEVEEEAPRERWGWRVTAMKGMMKKEVEGLLKMVE
jgi:hypothetical protein